MNFCDEHDFSPAFKSFSGGDIGDLEIDRCKRCPAVRVTQSALVPPDWHKAQVVTYVPALEPDRESVIREGISSGHFRDPSKDHRDELHDGELCDGTCS